MRKAELADKGKVISILSEVSLRWTLSGNAGPQG